LTSSVFFAQLDQRNPYSFIVGGRASGEHWKFVSIAESLPFGLLFG